MTNGEELQIYLVGVNQLQNELLAYFITNEVGAICTVVASLGCVPPVETITSANKRLVLYDFSAASETLEGLIASDTENILQSDYLVLTNLSHTLHIEIEALHCGIRGFLYYQGGTEVLVKMIRAVQNAEFWISREVISDLVLNDKVKRKPSSTERVGTLSRREIDILNGIAKGLTNEMIADLYCLSPHTVKTHIHHIFKKLKVSNRLQAARWASDHL